MDGETSKASALRARVLRGLVADDAAARAAAARAIAAQRPDDVALALREALGRERDGDARTAMLVALVALGGDDMLRAVARTLRSLDPAVVAGAARVLGAVGDRRVVPNLVEAFRTEDAVVGAAVAAALGALGDPVVVPWLVAACEQGFCVEASCRALGTLGDRRALPALRRRVDEDDRRVRLAAREALQRFEERPTGEDHVDGGASAEGGPEEGTG
ncbi:MAG: HEAT repeat domain-containing protein [Deltaproteobacteria bacterium]|nr:HEAT repeat domain-containing protein [Deltaproteobacteria bacterium]